MCVFESTVTTAVDFGVTQVVDGNWGVHADIPKWVFDKSDAPFDYSCTTSMGPGRRRSLLQQDNNASTRRALLAEHGVEQSASDYVNSLFSRVAEECASCEPEKHSMLANKLVEAKLEFAKKRKLAVEASKRTVLLESD